MPEPAAKVAIKTDIVVIGAGQAGLSAAYHLKQRGLVGGRGFVVLDQSPAAGGAWQFRWPSLTLSTVNRIHDLPGLSFAEAVPGTSETVEAAVAVPQYFAAYERRFELPVYRPVKVAVVCERNGRFRVETDREALDVALACCIKVTASEARIARIRDTKHLEWLYASAALVPDLLATGDCDIVRGAQPIGFDAAGRFTDELPA